MRGIAIVAATFALVVLSAGCGRAGRPRVVRISTFPVPEGPGPVVAAGHRLGAFVSLLPRVLPSNPAQSCAFGPIVRVALGDGTTRTYGPCERPPAIERVRRALLRAAGRHAPGGPVSPQEWKAVLADWYDGRMDHWHRCAAVREAIRHLPTDQPIYSTVRTDLESYEQAVC